ncbi:type 1 glutamine amidotransferase [Tropicibacter oceani]|uniref:Type 1 glutamine amidotransferase n=1 Tax=Tropicibacter oceani TaxID=3058420 RepID=A0ABY8QHE8_9RHOB|nr:type 1 glutamine amidotransferase [Tropicibacter oceani]WGW03396.1 type 1 glutamine amidotransferase [Tropicibacter oceani]
MKIGILQTGLTPDTLLDKHGTYPDMFERLLADQGFDFDRWSVVDGEFPEGPEAADGWLITGSRHGAYEDLPWIPRLEELIRQIVAADRPLIGVCFGHQIMAQALGGKVEKYKGGWAVGPQVYDFPEGPRTIQAWHQDQVTQLPEGAEVVASNDFCPYAALVYPGKAYSLQPHPEYGDDFIQGLIETRGRGVVPDDQLDAAMARMGTPLNSADIARQFARFFRERSLS